MYLYNIFFLLLTSSILEVFCKKDNFSRRFLFGVFVILICLLFSLSCLRWERGTDWLPYYDYFLNDSTKLNFLHHFENGFISLNYIVRATSDNYTILLVIEALIIYVCLFRSIKTLSVYPLFSLLCFFSIMKGGIFFVRQTIAVAILLLSVKFILRRQLLKFIFLVIIATLIHRSSLFFLPCYWIATLKKGVLFYLGVLLIICCASFIILRFVGDTSISTGNPFIDAKINGYLTSGMENEMYGVTMSKETMLIRGFAKRAVFLLLISIFLWKQVKNNDSVRAFFNIYIIGVCLYLIFAPISIDFARAVLPFDLMDIFLLPLIVYHQRHFFNKILLFMIICALSFNRLYSSIELRPDLFIPYKSIFNKELKVETY